MKWHYFLLMFLPLCIIITSCKKDSFITTQDARLGTSADSLKYDTVITTTGSITQSFKIFNYNNKILRLSNVQLMGGAASAYKININGNATNAVSNVDIAANDSIYIFVSVLINQSTTNLPFIVSDSILIEYNGNKKFIQLQAYGQNATFLNNQTINTNTTWVNTKPYVILGGLLVNNNVTLTIPKGCKIYTHGPAPILIDGTLIINGTKIEPVTFAGDRLDAGYKDYPASWPGIYFRDNCKNNLIQFAVIKNAYQAIVLQNPSVNINPKLIIHQSIIDNAYDAGIYCSNSSLQIDNSLISNCGSNILINNGGDYNFTNCTAASFSNNYITHKNPVLSINNFALQTNGTVTNNNLNATFTNCIFWADSSGFVNNDVQVNKQGSNTFNVLFQKNIYKGNANPSNSTLIGNLLNINPQFNNIDITNKLYDFRITNSTTAPGINMGLVTSFTKDLDDNNRNISLPDLGCYEKQ